jgi:hypothetical protein
MGIEPLQALPFLKAALLIVELLGAARLICDAEFVS